MKTINFIRHGQLAAPFDNYNTLPYEEFCKLAKSTNNPAIDNTSTELLKQNFTIDPQKIEVIFTSPTLRTKQTAKFISETFSLKLEPKILNELREIPFDPQKLPQNPQLSRLESIRSNFYTSLVSNHMLETFSELERRLNTLDQLISQREESNILCITHGFLISLINSYYDNDRQLVADKVRQIDTSISTPYFSGIEINI